MMCALVVLCIHNMCTCYLCNVMYRMVQIGLCEYCIWGVVHIVLSSCCICNVCSYGALCMLDMQFCVWMMLFTCWICSDMYMWCCVHVVHMVLCTYGVVCIIVQVVL